MSAKIVGEVWGLKLPREQKYVLLSLADHADHEGCHVFPSVGLLAWKTEYSERQIRRVMGELESAGVIVPTNRRDGEVTEYRIDLSQVPRKEPRTSKRGRPASANKTPNISAQAGKTPDTVTGVKPKTPDIMTGDKNKTPDIPAENPGHLEHITPDIFDTPSYSLCETSEETSLETERESRKPPSLSEKSELPGSPETAGDDTNQSAESGPSEKAYSPDMLAFWAAYPAEGRARGTKAETQTEWQRMTPADRLAASAGLECALKVAQFRDFPKAPHRWLRFRSWETFTDNLPGEMTVLKPEASNGSALGAASAERAERFKRLRSKT